MNPAVAGKGWSFAGTVQYITHDVQADTQERVDFVQTVNLRTGDPEKAAKIMAWTAINANMLKADAGLKATGRKSGPPVFHYSLNWEPSEDPSHEEMTHAALETLKVLGYEAHQAVLAVHTDKAHKHIHVVVNRVHPETGKMHNPEHDKKKLQRWAYGYEKERGKIYCLDRAIKHEKDPALRAEYKRQKDQEIAQGVTRESQPRPQWEAEQEAQYPNSGRAKALKTELAKRVKQLVETNRANYQRRMQESQTLKDRQKQERRQFFEQHNEKYRNLKSFNDAAQGRVSRDQYRQDKAALWEKHCEQFQSLRAELKAKNAPAVQTFHAEQKAAWRDFYRLERAERSGKLDETLGIVTSTKVGQHTPEYHGHLSRLFQVKAALPDRKEAFAATCQQQKQAFYQSIAQQNAPAYDRLKTQQKAERLALRTQFDQAAEQQQHKAEYHAKSQQERAGFFKQQTEARQQLRTRHKAEIKAEQQAWATFNAERREAWRQYNAEVQKQLEKNARTKEGQWTKEPDKSQSNYFNERQTVSRDYGGGRNPEGGNEQGAGKGQSRDRRIS